MYLALGIATVIYVAVSLGVFGTLTVDKVIDSGGTAIAVAAEPVLGDVGFVMIALAAMFATSSATNANLYGASHLTQMLGTINTFPKSFANPTKRGRPGGLMITSASALVLAIGFDITAIASMGTAIALVLFVMLCIAGIQLRSQTGASILPMVIAIFAILVVLTLFIIDTLESAPWTVVVMLGFFVLSVALEFGWKRYQRQHPPAATPAPAG
jgi:amino acid transporter